MTKKRTSPAHTKNEIEEFIHQFFSQGILSEKISQAEKLGKMEGVSMYLTPVPWIISLPQNERIEGYSEKLKTAVHDLLAQFRELTKKYPATTPINVDIDINRLPNQFKRRKEPEAKTHG